MAATTKKVTLIPGDGIGPEIIDAVVSIFKAANIPIEWDIQQAGFCALDKHSTPLPETTLSSIKKNGVALKGPCTTPVGEGFRSINVELRTKLKLFANKRPAKSIPGLQGRYSDIDLITIRENTEGLYCGKEKWLNDDKTAAESASLVTQEASERIIRYAFETALKENRKKVTLVHKANILKLTGGLFLNVGRQISKEFEGKIEFEDLIIDNMCMQLVLNPHRFDVIVATNLFGDILSDLTAGLIGGLGLAPAANMGDGVAVFEAVHGSAPDIAGQKKANPTALLLSAIMMLRHLGWSPQADQIQRAVLGVLKAGKALTADLGGSASTDEYTAAIIKSL